MYKISTIPQSTSSLSDLADYLEIKCVLSDTGTYSISEARSSIGITSEDSEMEGINSDEDRLYEKLSEALGEIDERKKRCRSRYPFLTSKNTVQFESDALVFPYLMMLFATRLDMRDQRIIENIDGAKLFERISAVAAGHYFGAKRAKYSVFGTGREDNESMECRVNSMLKDFHEPYVFKQPEGGTGKYKDGKLDVVIYLPFTDERRNMFIGFGQCKTGTNWEHTLTQLRPNKFFEKFSTGIPCYTPIRMFFVAEACRDKWEENARDAGLFFDRCRIMDCLPQELPMELVTDTATWVGAVIGKYSQK